MNNITEKLANFKYDENQVIVLLGLVPPTNYSKQKLKINPKS